MNVNNFNSVYNYVVLIGLQHLHFFLHDDDDDDDIDDDATVVGHAFLRHRHRLTVTLPLDELDDEPELEPPLLPIIFLNINGPGSASASASAYGSGSADAYANVFKRKYNCFQLVFQTKNITQKIFPWKNISFSLEALAKILKKHLQRKKRQ